MSTRTPPPPPPPPRPPLWPLAAIILCCYCAAASAKTYERCELAKELRDQHGLPEDEVATWVCIAFHESRFDTAAVGRLSGNSLDHGLFQISDLYWCGAHGPGGGCGVPCSRFHDDDIADDVKCVREIHRQHKRYTGDGFNAWAVYQRGDCIPAKTDKFVEGCFQPHTRDTTRDTMHDTTHDTMHDTTDDTPRTSEAPSRPADNSPSPRSRTTGDGTKKILQHRSTDSDEDFIDNEWP